MNNVIGFNGKIIKPPPQLKLADDAIKRVAYAIMKLLDEAMKTAVMRMDGQEPSEAQVRRHGQKFVFPNGSMLICWRSRPIVVYIPKILTVKIVL